jgi:hypothetical protein
MLRGIDLDKDETASKVEEDESKVVPLKMRIIKPIPEL